jgi:hypothetical protein
LVIQPARSQALSWCCLDSSLISRRLKRYCSRLLKRSKQLQPPQSRGMSPWAQTPFQQRAGPAIQVVSTGTQVLAAPGAPELLVDGSCMVTVPLPSCRKAIRRPATWMAQRSPGRSTCMLQLCQGPSPSLQRKATGSARAWEALRPTSVSTPTKRAASRNEQPGIRPAGC